MGVSISKTSAGGDGVSEIVQLHIFVEDDDWRGQFDRIEVWRSRGLSTGPFDPIMASSWLPARLPAEGGSQPASPVTGPTVDVVGRDLQLRLNELDDLVVNFTDPGPGVLTLAQAAAQVTSQSAGRLRAWVASDGRLVMETVQPGTSAALRVVGGDAVSLLGLSAVEPFSLAFGKDAYPSLVLGKQRYTVTDLRGSGDYFYRTRFRQHATGAVSEFTVPATEPRRLGVTPGNLVSGRLELVGLDGSPLANVLVRVYNRFAPQVVEGKLISGTALDGLTNDDGLLELTLVRGTELTIAIDGTSIVRDITVPSDPGIGVFNLLDPSVGPDDYWRVREADIEYAPRRSL